MAGTVQFFGGATGLPSDLIDRLMEVEKSRYNKMQKTRSATAAQQSSFDTLSGKLLALKTKAKDLQESTSWTPHTASSSNSDKIGITASSEANAANHYVEVERLATHNALMLGIGGTSGAAPGTGISKTDSDTGLTSGHTTLDFTYNGDAYSVSLSIGDSLSDVADKINALDFGTEEGVSAGVIFDGTNYRLSMSARDSGALTRNGDATGTTNQSRISITSMDLQFGGSAIMNASALFTTDEGVDARMKVDGLTGIFSSSNTVSDVITGVTMDLKETTTAAVTLTVANDKDAAKSTLQGFVDSYNDAVDFINSKKSTDFAGEAAIRGVLSQVRLELNTATDGVSGKYNVLSQMGVQTDSQTGKLAIDTDKFDTAVDKDFGSLKEIFANEPATGTQGLAFRLESLMEQLTKTSGGVISSKKSSLGDTLERIDNNISREERRLEQIRKRLTTKYARLEQMVSTLNGSSSAMSAALSRM